MKQRERKKEIQNRGREGAWKGKPWPAAEVYVIDDKYFPYLPYSSTELRYNLSTRHPFGCLSAVVWLTACGAHPQECNADIVDA